MELTKKALFVAFARRSRILAAVGALLLVFCGGLLLVPESMGVRGLNTLDDLAAYAAQMPEHVPMDNTNLVRPEYGKFYRSQKRGFLARKWHLLLTALGIKRSFSWAPRYFLSLLDLELNRLKSYKVEKNIIYKIAANKNSRIVVVGDLGGAYHSLVRNLQKMHEMGIINEYMKITAPDTYIVFMGSAISRSSYGMETLGVLLHLMEMNFDTVVYLRGNHEDNKYWEAFGLKEQLAIVLGEQANAAVNTINSLFMHLPLGLYVAIPEQKHRFVRLSHLSSADSTKLKESSYSHFLEARQRGMLDRHEITKEVDHNEQIEVDACIHSEVKRNTFQLSEGLRQMPSDGGAIAWTLLSAPTLVNQKGLNFVSDAFAIIKAAEKKEDWLITLYTQDANKKNGYKEVPFQFFTGALPGVRVEAPEAPQEAAATVTLEKSVPFTPVAPEAAAESSFVKMLAGVKKPLVGTEAPVTTEQKSLETAAVLPAQSNEVVAVTVGAATPNPVDGTTSVPITVTLRTSAHSEGRKEAAP